MPVTRKAAALPGAARHDDGSGTAAADGSADVAWPCVSDQKRGTVHGRSPAPSCLGLWFRITSWITLRYRLQACSCSSKERAPAASATSVTLARDHRPAHLTSTGFSDRHAYAYPQ